jgi:hypothetical protein
MIPMLLTAVSGNATEDATEAELRDYDGTWTAKLRGQHGVISMGDGSDSDEDEEGPEGPQRLDSLASCILCGMQAITRPLQRCSRCKSDAARFCCRACQMRSWPQHKAFCIQKS